MKGKLDKIDLRILALLQEDATITVAQISSRVNLSQTPCWRRIQRLEEAGIIERRVAILNPESVGRGPFQHLARRVRSRGRRNARNHGSAPDGRRG